MPLSASRQLVPPKWCPSCSLALLRAFASVCGTTLPAPARRVGGSRYRHLSSLSSKNGRLRIGRNPGGINGTCSGPVATQRSYGSNNGKNDYEEEESGPTMEEIEEINEKWEKSGLKKAFRNFEADLKDLSLKKMQEMEEESIADMLRGTPHLPQNTEEPKLKPKTELDLAIQKELDERLERMRQTAARKREAAIKKDDRELVAKQAEADATKTEAITADNHASTLMNASEEDIEGASEIIEREEGEIYDTKEGLEGVEEVEIWEEQEDGEIEYRAAEEEDLEYRERDGEYIEHKAEGKESIEHSIEEEIEGRAEEEEDIEYRASEPAAPSPTSDGTPWYLQSPLQPAPRRFVSPLIEQMPELPPNSPAHLGTLLNYLIKDLSLSKIKIMDIRGLEPTPALGPNTIMILATARSERHMTIASDKCCRYMRGILEGTQIFADGLIGRGEIKLRERRERRKGKRRTAEDEEALRVGWICVNSGQGIVVQIMTGWKREQLNLEGLWSRKIHTSMKRKLKDKLLAEGLSEDEVRTIVAKELPERLDMAPEYDAQEDAAEARKVEAKLIVSEILPPLEDPPRVGMEEYQDVLKVVELHSKSRKKQEGKRYIDIPAVKQRKLTWREKQKQLNSVSFSTKYAFSTSARQYSTFVETIPAANLLSLLNPTRKEELPIEELVRQGRYQEVLKAYPRPRTDAQATLVLLAHLNHLILTPRNIATTTLLSPNPEQLYSTPFFKSFMLSFPKRPAPTHNHILTLLHIYAHDISPLLYTIRKYAIRPSEILQSGHQVPLITYHAILRALATSASLRGDEAKSLTYWTNRTTDTISIMTLYILRKMDVTGIEVGNDPEIFESLWLAMAPRDTLEYIATLGDARLRGGVLDDSEPFSRALDHRLDLYRTFHRIWYDPFKFIPAECSYFRGPPVEEDVLEKLLHKKIQYPPENPRGAYQSLPSYLVTMFVTLARANGWGRLKGLWRWLPGKGVRRPKALYALYLELLAREAEVRAIIEGLRFLLSDYEKEYAGREDVSDGIAEALVACVGFIETEVPGTGQEFGNWKRRSEAFLSGGTVTREKGNYTYVI
ncbi:ATPase synthesis protein 25 mitochondrial [Orbilia blumenaviensis]|uniref:ATPase synthesis protein 25 n=1 Tax=Orbilia blumenaviensis TaxID=1796055 RepID=A0AAV9VMV2_9PEZI